VLSGLLLALPLALTIWIVYQAYGFVRGLLLDPLSQIVTGAVARSEGGALPAWWVQWVAPLVAACLVLLLLYILGYFVSSRIARAVDWLMAHLPGVDLVYKALRDVFASLNKQRLAAKPQRVVLVPFPHPGTKALAIVNQELKETGTGRSILCVFVMTSVVPPAGFTLFVPESDVVDAGWPLNTMFQTILSGGLTAPPAIPYETGTRTTKVAPPDDSGASR
jgi:uncharacterized membrane protein